MEDPDMRIWRWTRRLGPAFCLILLWGCGYQMVGGETHVPPGIRSVSIKTFINQTLEPGIEIPFTQAFLREFILDRRVKVVDRKEADSVLEGSIKSFNVFSVSYDASGLAKEYQTTVAMDVILKKPNGDVLWEEKNLTETRWYRTSPSILITEGNKQVALQQAGQFMAERIRNRFFYNF
jgi:outer membrane lipopolysaccharide assembly protein LptE/RlpB